MATMVDERPREAVCTGYFRIVTQDAAVVVCDRCGATADWDEPALAAARAQHARLPQFPIGPNLVVTSRIG